VVIPARRASARLPDKLLLDLRGRPVLAHALDLARAVTGAERVILATEDAALAELGARAGIEVVWTGPCANGTERVARALALLGAEPEVVLGLQADEPLLDPAALDRLLAAFRDDAVQAATLACPLREAHEATDPAVVKVVLDQAGQALYFSRAAVPDGAPWTALRRHLGVYAWRPAALRRFLALPPAPLEAWERLEQLRWLTHGGRWQVVEVPPQPPGLDTPADLAALRAWPP
jgi:3-deoxy-manno-octulosonate cytidylyltransferase (CMP-KDO synthetase)